MIIIGNLIGKILNSNNYGDFKVIDFVRKDKYNNKYYKIKFLDTGYETNACKSNLRRGFVRDKTDKMIGKIIESNNSGEFKVIEFKGKRKGNKYYRIKFLKTKYETICSYSNILNKEVKDHLQPILAGVGFLGEKGMSKEYKKEHNLWKSMIERCYYKKSINYSIYGGEGVKVCERWYNFSNFVDDLPKIDGYDKEKFENGKLHLDKDFKQKSIPKNKMIYSLKTCKFVTPKENIKESNKRKHSNQKYFKAISPTGKVYYSYNQSEFARNNNMYASYISKVLRGKKEQYKGWKFEYL